MKTNKFYATVFELIGSMLQAALNQINQMQI